jgi:hypothetical protein
MTTTLQPTSHTSNHLTIHPSLHPSLHPTEQAVRLHRSHLATTHRAPLVARASVGPRARATSFTPMAPAATAAEMPMRRREA